MVIDGDLLDKVAGHTGRMEFKVFLEVGMA